MNKTVVFRFDASIKIGAGHAIRSMVLANRFKELSWNVLIATKSETYDFISILNEFKRIEPESLLDGNYVSDILIIDTYEVDVNLESKFRKYAKKIIVIDDLANRSHDCDILIDQTYGRSSFDYQKLVPNHCKILAGSNFILIRDDFLKIKSKALEKRRKTKKIDKILVTMGGSDPNNVTLQALKKIYSSTFQGQIDVILGFTNQHYKKIFEFTKIASNKINIHTNPDMPKLIYEADLCVGASGSGIWERLCMFLPNVIYLTANNQKNIYESLIKNHLAYSSDVIHNLFKVNYQSLIQHEDIVSGLGVEKILKYAL